MNCSLVLSIVLLNFCCKIIYADCQALWYLSCSQRTWNLYTWYSFAICKRKALLGIMWYMIPNFMNPFTMCVVFSWILKPLDYCICSIFLMLHLRQYTLLVLIEYVICLWLRLLFLLFMLKIPIYSLRTIGKHMVDTTAWIQSSSNFSHLIPWKFELIHKKTAKPFPFYNYPVNPINHQHI